MRGEISFEMRCKFVANLIELDINLHLYCIKYEEWLTIYDAEYGPRSLKINPIIANEPLSYQFLIRNTILSIKKSNEWLITK